MERPENCLLALDPGQLEGGTHQCMVGAGYCAVIRVIDANLKGRPS